MAHIQAFVVITLLIWVAVSVSGTTTELSTTAGDTVNIACLFGDGTVINIYWYYNNGTGRQKLLFLAKGNITLGAEYANRASLQDDNSTLILENITVVDMGTYCCDVDRKGQIPKQNINTKLNVFSLRPDTLPKITPCSRVDESSSCIVHRNQSFTLTCTLSNVYPVEDTELIWYQDGKRVLSTDNITQNDDGATDISRQIQVSKTGNFTCNATYISANGRENTAVSVKARIIIIPAIIQPTDVPNTPDKNLTNGPIVGIALSVATVLIVGILLCICCLKKRSHCCSKRDEQNSEVVQPDPEQFKLIETSAQDGSKDGNDSSKPTERPTAAAEEGDNSTLSPSPTVAHGGNVNRSDQRRIKDEEIMTLSTLMLHDNYTAFCLALGFGITNSENIVVNHQLNYNTAFRDILNKWKTQTGGFTRDLDEALVEANSGGLIEEYKI